MITFEVNSIRYDNVLSASFQESMVEFTNEASFIIALDGNEDAPFLIDDKCIVFVDDNPVMVGFIYDVNLSYGSGNHSLEYIVRDKTADFSDSDLDNMEDLSGSLSLTDIIRRVAEHLKTDIRVVNEFPELKNFNLDNDDIKPEFGQNAFDYVEGLARKRQVLLSTNPDGNIEIFRNNLEEVDGIIQNSIFEDSDRNNIIAGSFSISGTAKFNRYVVRSQLSSASSKSKFGSGVSNKEITSQVGEFIDNKVRVGRQRCLIAEESSVSGINKDRAKWQKQFSDVQSRTYSVELLGHSIEENIFRSNTLIHVIDDFARLDDLFLIKSVNMSFDLRGGSLTSLELVNKNAFRVLSEAQEQESDEEKDNIFTGI